MRQLIFLGLLVLAAPALADVFPSPGSDNPRVQSAAWVEGEKVVLTALPETGLTVMLEPGETITRMTLGEAGFWDVRVSAERDSFLLLPRPNAIETSLAVETVARHYDFILETGSGLMAAYLVRFDAENTAAPEPKLPRAETEPINIAARYRLRGDEEVRPADIRDDGVRTAIAFAPDQALPAIFAIGPTGDEEVVNGYMRGDLYVIDRVYDELVFRIDKKKAEAQRKQVEGGEG